MDDLLTNMTKLQLIRSGKPTLAGMLLFGNHGYSIHIGRFKAGTFRISEMGDFFRVELMDARSIDSGKDDQTPGKTPGKTQARILELLSRDPHLSIPDIAGQIQKSESATQRALRKLREAGIVEREGSAKTGYWKIITRPEG